MVPRALLLGIIALATTVAACTADPLSPSATGTVSLDEAPCDTIYLDSAEYANWERPEDECYHVVLINY